MGLLPIFSLYALPFSNYYSVRHGTERQTTFIIPYTSLNGIGVMTDSQYWGVVCKPRLFSNS